MTKVVILHKTTLTPQQLGGGGAAHFARVKVQAPHTLSTETAVGGWGSHYYPAGMKISSSTQPSVTPPWQWGWAPVTA